MIAAAPFGVAAGLLVTLVSSPGRAGGASGTPDDGFSWPGAGDLAARDLVSLDRAQRLRAVDRLIQRDGPELGRLLEPLLQDSEPGVRAAAARALLRRGAPAAIEAATRWASSATPPERLLGLEVLREATALPAGARRALERGLADSDTGVRLLAIDALARQELATSFAAVASALDDEHREIRLRAIRLLERSKDPRAPLIILGRLTDADRSVRLEAIHALGALGDARVVPALTRELQEGSDDVRLAAALALGRLRAAAAVPALATLARRRPVDDLARQAQLALGEIATPAALAVLIERLREPPLSEQTRDALRRAGPVAVEPLLAEVQNGTISSRSAAVALLGELGDRRATAALSELVERRAGAAVAAAVALAALKDPAAVVTLVQAAADPRAATNLRRQVYQALLAIGDRRAVGAVAGGLADPDPTVRQAALQLAARLHARDAAPAIVARLRDDDEDVRREAVATLLALDVEVEVEVEVEVDVRPPGTVAALLDALRLGSATGGARRAADRAALGDALEAAARESEGALLAKALIDAAGADQAPIARGLLAAHQQRLLEGEAVVDRLFQMLNEVGATAEAAADLLAVARLTEDDGVRLLRAFDEAEPGVRARLCAALGRGPGQALARLDVALQDEAEAVEVRAAAAWAGATRRSAGRPILETLARAEQAPPPLAANARAALASTSTAASTATWVGVRLLSPSGAPLPRRWLMARAPGGPWVWFRTGDDGLARFWRVGRGPVEVSAAEPAAVSLRRWPASE